MQHAPHLAQLILVAPRAGAWIEIPLTKPSPKARYVAPRAGAWIEIQVLVALRQHQTVAPRAGAWIEMIRMVLALVLALSHPVRVRGLKSLGGR